MLREYHLSFVLHDESITTLCNILFEFEKKKKENSSRFLNVRFWFAL